MIIGKRPVIELFLSRPDAGVRAALIYGRDMGVVRDRGHQLAGKIAKDPNDPFDVAQLTGRRPRRPMRVGWRWGTRRSSH